jgi:hypothetical protein
MNEPRKRHRWEATSDHFYPGPKYWVCIHCGLQKTTEWEEKPNYHFIRDRRTWRWHRFVPSCPPDLTKAKEATS